MSSTKQTFAALSSSQVTQAAWKASGKQLVDAELQAAAKLAAKKARKLRQKHKRQPLQQLQPAGTGIASQHSLRADPPDTPSKTFHLQQETPPSCTSSSAAAAPQLDAGLRAGTPSGVASLGPASRSAAHTRAAAPANADQASPTSGASSCAAQGLQPLGSPGRSAEPISACQKPAAHRQAPINAVCPALAADDSMDDEAFLQALFSCPLSKVSHADHHWWLICTSSQTCLLYNLHMPERSSGVCCCEQHEAVIKRFFSHPLPVSCKQRFCRAATMAGICCRSLDLVSCC